MSAAIVRVLSPHVKPRRLERMKEILDQRRADVQLVRENIVDDANAVRCSLFARVGPLARASTSPLSSAGCMH